MTNWHAHKKWEIPLAFTDIESTGVDWRQHEIIEIGLVLADQQSLEVMDTLEIKVQPLHMDNADPAGIARNGYRPEDWAGAGDLKTAMTAYGLLTKGATFCSWHSPFDFGFITEGFLQSGVKNELVENTELCIYSMARFAFRHERLEPFSLQTVAARLGLQPEPPVHRAINGAQLVYEVYKALAKRG